MKRLCNGTKPEHNTIEKLGILERRVEIKKKSNRVKLHLDLNVILVCFGVENSSKLLIVVLRAQSIKVY